MDYPYLLRNRRPTWPQPYGEGGYAPRPRRQVPMIFPTPNFGEMASAIAPAVQSAQFGQPSPPNGMDPVWNWISDRAVPVVQSALQKLNTPMEIDPENRSGLYNTLAWLSDTKPLTDWFGQQAEKVGQAAQTAYDFTTKSENDFRRGTDTQFGPPMPPPAPFIPQLPDGMNPTPAVERNGGGVTNVTAGPTPGLNSMAIAIIQQMREAGYSDVAISGVLGNLQQESGIVPNGARGDNGTAFGVAQWRGDRQAALRAFAAARGLDPASVEAQAAFIPYELSTTEGAARQRLLAASTPEEAAAAGLWYERPQGFNPEQFNPAAVHGWGNRLGSAQSIYNSMRGMAPLPPVVENYSSAPPPSTPAPIDQPLPAQPNFDVVNSYLDAARPGALPQGAPRWAQVLQGIAAGAAGADPYNGPGAVLAAMGAGGMTGLVNAQNQERDDAAAQQERMRAYNLTRADAASGQTNALTNWQSSANDIGWRNRQNIQDVAVANALNVWKVDSDNKQRQFEANQTNRQNLYEYDSADWQARQPSIAYAGDKGIAIQQGGRINWQQSPMAIGQPDAVTEFQQAQATGGYPAGRDVMIQQAVATGKAPVIFGPLYDQALEVATERVSALGLFGEQAATAMQQALAAELSKLTLQLGDDSWMIPASQMGIYGYTGQ